MTITTDLDAALADEEAKVQCGKRPKAGMRWRMGPGARAALVALADPSSGDIVVRDGMPLEYRSIPIEPIDPPSHSAPATSDRFHGWELRS